MKHVFLQLRLLISSYLYPLHLQIHSFGCSSFCSRPITAWASDYTQLSEDPLRPCCVSEYFSSFYLFAFLFSSPSFKHLYFIPFFWRLLFQALYKVYFTCISPNSLLPLTSHSKAWTSLMLLILYYTVEKG